MQDTASALVIASPLRRTAAYFLDGLILAVITLAAAVMGIVRLSESQWGAADVESLIAVLVGQAAYNIGFVATRGATPGKMALQIEVCDPEGKPVTPDTAILRYVVLLIGNLLVVGLVASMLLLFVDKKRRTVHDRVAKTLVVMARPREQNYPSSGARAR